MIDVRLYVMLKHYKVAELNRYLSCKLEKVVNEGCRKCVYFSACTRKLNKVLR